MTRAEAEADVRQFNRRCKGPLLIPTDKQKELFAFIAMMKMDQLPELVPMIVAERRAMRLPPEMLDELDDGIPPRGLRLAADHAIGDVMDWAIRSIRAREQDRNKPCGLDFNDTIIAHPFDGQLRAYICPRCGTTGEFRSPTYEVTEPPPA
jgi:hypothetical protein